MPEKMQDAHLAETLQYLRPYVQNINNVSEKIDNSEEEEDSITKSIGKLDGGTTESHGETRRQRLHLQLRSRKLHYGKRVRAWKPTSSEKWYECVDRTPTHKTQLCSTVCLQHEAQVVCTAQDLHAYWCPKLSVVICCATCLISWLFSHALSSMSISSSPTYPTTQREQPSTTCTSPSSLGQQVAPSRIILA